LTTRQNPPIELIEGQIAALQTLRTEVAQLYPFSAIVKKRSTGKTPVKARLFTLQHIIVHHRNNLAKFLSTEFVSPINLLQDYGKRYASAMSSMYFYASLVYDEVPVNLPRYKSGAGYGLEDVNAAITRAWRLAQDVLKIIEISQKRLGEISVSWRESVQWMDRVVAMENEKSGTAWCSELLCDVLVRLEGLKESYRPMTEFFNLQEVHLRLLQERINSDANSRMDYAHPVLSANGPGLPSPPVMPYPWHTVWQRARWVVREWQEFAAPSKTFLYFHHFRTMFILDIEAVIEHEETERSLRASRRVKRAFSRLFHPSEISAH
jgi:hypothetical protein